MSVCNSSLGEVIRAHLHSDFVTGKDADEELSHFSTHVREQFLTVLQSHLETSVGQCLDNLGIQCNFLFFCFFVFTYLFLKR